MVIAIVVAAGEGKRMKEDVPKQFLLLGGRPILWYSLSAFEKNPVINETILVINPLWEKKGQEIAKEFSKIKYIVPGGKFRQESVWAGLKMIKNAEIVLVHDGVRPFISQKLIEAVIKGAYKYGAVVPALPVKETVKWVEGDIVKKTLPRDYIWLIQTPQGFKFDILKTAYLRFRKEIFTDDASLVEKLGINVHVILGEQTNIKITIPQDLKWAEILLNFL
ncbi:MAG: 2-C-methyl-D-erythritol 4-phosphate cytidylyltransferase [Candidatus Desulfofervidus auxilii]|nr:2-C-methyl-D-erythritol 4-phosphate cytidylyltransferase [Candidatus Desulfofervidus auxilii]